MKTAIELENISHEFTTHTDSIRLFDRLSLTILPGQTLAIVGPSGAGKSSLLSIAAGLEAPTAGTVRFTLGGAEVDARTLRAHSGFVFQQFHLMPELRAHSGFVFQQFHLMPELDAIGNLALPLRLKGVPDAFDQAAEWLAKVGLADRARHRPHQLSGGEQQRIALARAFISNPTFLFADEPTGNLDARTSESVASLMFDCAKETGCGLVIVTHSRRLAALADTRLHLEAGQLEMAA